jgi:hypothetical protein
LYVTVTVVSPDGLVVTVADFAVLSKVCPVKLLRVSVAAPLPTLNGSLVADARLPLEATSV